MALLGRNALDFAAKRSARLAANAKGDWRKVAAYGAAAAVVFVVAAVGYAGLSKFRRGEDAGPGPDAEPEPDREPDPDADPDPDAEPDQPA